MRNATCCVALLVTLAASALAQEYTVIAHKPDPSFALDGDLSDWADVPASATDGTGSEVSASHTVLTTDAHMFYRVRTDP